MCLGVFLFLLRESRFSLSELFSTGLGAPRKWTALLLELCCINTRDESPLQRPTATCELKQSGGMPHNSAMCHTVMWRYLIITLPGDKSGLFKTILTAPGIDVCM